MTSTPYTHGVWIVTPGREEQFIAAWTELAEWTLSEVPGSKWGKLLRDSSTRNRFVSFGPWESVEAITAWRALPDWGERVERLKQLLESFEPYTLELVAEAG